MLPIKCVLVTAILMVEMHKTFASDYDSDYNDYEYKESNEYYDATPSSTDYKEESGEVTLGSTVEESMGENTTGDLEPATVSVLDDHTSTETPLVTKALSETILGSTVAEGVITGDPKPATVSATDDHTSTEAPFATKALPETPEVNSEAPLQQFDPNGYWQSDLQKKSLVPVILLQHQLMNFTNAIWQELNSDTNMTIQSEHSMDKKVQEHSRHFEARFKSLETRAIGTLGILRRLSQKQGNDLERSKIWDKLEKKINKVWKICSQYNSLEPEEKHNTSISEARDTREQLLAATDSINEMAYGICGNEYFYFPVSDKRTARYRCGGEAFEFLNSTTTKQDKVCNSSNSAQQLALEFYSLLALTEAKVYAVTQVLWMISHMTGARFSRKFQQNALTVFEKRATSSSKAIRAIIGQYSTWYGPCASRKLLENNTYIQFTELLQAYVIYESNLNIEGTCSGECSDFREAKEWGCDGTSCKAKRCDKGKLHGCKSFQTSVCISKDKNRRYGLIGDKSSNCEKGQMVYATSWRNWNRNFKWTKPTYGLCSNCICHCDQPGPQSDRYISLKPSIANTQAGNIVTGVKFVKKGRVVHIQIQEGKALPRGSVNASSIQWQPVESIDPEVNNKTDNVALSWGERSIALDRFVAPDGHVLTGLRFRRSLGYINVEMQVAPIKFSSGWIDFTEAFWLETPNRLEEPKLIPMTDADTPLKRPNRPTVDHCSEHRSRYVNFQATSIEKDIAQTTIPFLDAQSVTPQPPTWLAGIALCYRETPGYSGFINLKVATYDMTGHIDG